MVRKVSRLSRNGLQVPNNHRKDKASGRVRQRENGSQTDEEFDGGHCCEGSAKLLEMNAKLDKLLTSNP